MHAANGWHFGGCACAFWSTAVHTLCHFPAHQNPLTSVMVGRNGTSLGYQQRRIAANKTHAGKIPENETLPRNGRKDYSYDWGIYSASHSLAAFERHKMCVLLRVTEP